MDMKPVMKHDNSDVNVLEYIKIITHYGKVRMSHEY